MASLNSVHSIRVYIVDIKFELQINGCSNDLINSSA